MDQLECIREQLYNAIESENELEILRISQELDKLILAYIQMNKIKKQTA